MTSLIYSKRSNGDVDSNTSIIGIKKKKKKKKEENNDASLAMIRIKPLEEKGEKKKEQLIH